MRFLFLIAVQLYLTHGFCPKDTIAVNGGCALASVLNLGPKQAEGVCNYMGGHLAAVHSAAMNAQLQQYALTIFESKINLKEKANIADRLKNNPKTRSTDLPVFPTIMLGAYRDGSHSNWMNYDGSAFDYDNFHTNASSIPTYNTLSYMNLTSQDGTWLYTMPGDYTQLPFMCNIANCPTNVNNTRKCPYGAEYAQTMDRCLIGQKRALQQTHQLQYWEAEASCTQIGGHLVIIQNAFQNSEVLQIAKDYLLDDFYIGFNGDMEIKPCHQWEDCYGWSWVDGSNSTYTDFYMPDVEGKGDLTVMQTITISGSAQEGQWRQIEDQPCTSASCKGYDWMCSLPPFQPQICPNM